MNWKAKKRKRNDKYEGEPANVLCPECEQAPAGKPAECYNTSSMCICCVDCRERCKSLED